MQKVIVITGASSGIGEELKNLYEKEGDIVVNLSKSVTEVDDKNFQVDVSNRELVFETFEKIFNIYNKIDVLINCAGYGVYGATEILTEKESRQIFDVNFFGTLWCSQACLKYMQKGGKIINIASACAIFALPYRTLYSASKSAVNMLSYGLRMELKDFGIDVVSINPGDIKTNFSKNRVVNLQNSEKYGHKLKDSFDLIAKREDSRMDKATAVRKIYKICKKKKPKAMYIIGGKYKFLNFGKNFISTSALLNITTKFF